ncbi:Acetylglutamate kinase [Candidatus Hydrogenisulfobacillus filiaventi]|uniref:acetylglutamate kinase n=1 Tax=Candidatus Hydrogenisulfobacillus filiaventi TaxID=2707344 RepID=A0A6F8ZIU0_9FIRM|nr:acetylglutamate kinase [Bacillota bacterium]CAB1129799.1 Acetylglutamate kinase [Candidatus Hydrogenisulfobacillus filiaventi]
MLVVVKVGGSVLGGADPWLEEVEAAVRSGQSVVVVHGGGAAISRAQARLQEPVRFVRGQRVTSPAALEVVVEVLSGRVNTALVAALEARGVPAVGLNGADDGLLEADPVPELGHVGRITGGRARLLQALLHLGLVPVVAPLALDRSRPGQVLNCNGDWAAAHVAALAGADALVFYTDSGGVRSDPEDPASVVERLDAATARRWMEEGRAHTGMVPKLEAALFALEAGVGTVRVGRLSAAAGTTIAPI